MRKVEIKRVEAGSVFKFYFTVGLIVGFIFSLIWVFSGTAIRDLGIQVGIAGFTDGPLKIGSNVIAVIVSSLAYGFAAGLSGAIGALLYNIIAAVTGGIIVRVNEE